MQTDLMLAKENGRLRQENAKHQTDLEAMQVRLRSAEQTVKALAKSLGKINAITTNASSNI